MVRKTAGWVLIITKKTKPVKSIFQLWRVLPHNMTFVLTTLFIESTLGNPDLVRTTNCQPSTVGHWENKEVTFQITYSPFPCSRAQQRRICRFHPGSWEPQTTFPYKNCWSRDRCTAEIIQVVLLKLERPNNGSCRSTNAVFQVETSGSRV